MNRDAARVLRVRRVRDGATHAAARIGEMHAAACIGASERTADAAARGASRPGARPAVRRIIATLLALLAAWLALDAGWLHAKAWLAQELLAEAWDDAQRTGSAHKPWPWADTHPVARLRVATRGIDQIVLAGDAGRTLAFGPGWAESSARPGARGTPVISGHRDTHFAFLRELATGDEIALQGIDGEARYRVSAARVADTRSETLAVNDADDALLLVTCWPFDAVVPGGPLRYVVRAARVDYLKASAN